MKQNRNVITRLESSLICKSNRHICLEKNEIVLLYRDKMDFFFYFLTKFFHKERMLRTRTWEEAERFCEALGGHLPSFSHSEEIKELHTILRKIIR